LGQGPGGASGPSAAGAGPCGRVEEPGRPGEAAGRSGGFACPNANDNRVYNNVFYGAGYAGVVFHKYDGTMDLSGNVFKNNILSANCRDLDKDPGTPESVPSQIYFYMMEGLDDNRFLNNCIIAQEPGENVIEHQALGAHTLAWWQENHSGHFAGNMEIDPNFVDEAGGDFRLRQGSPCVDAGTHLAVTVGAGSGMEMAVDDAGYFCDGHSIVEADWIKVGAAEPVQISSIDYDANVIALTEARGWSDGDPIYLHKNSSGEMMYNGEAPDIGAYEYEQEEEMTLKEELEALRAELATLNVNTTALIARIDNALAKLDEFEAAKETVLGIE